MKQLLTKVGISTILAFVSILTSVAANVTFSYSDYKGQGTNSSGSAYTMTKTEVSISNTKFYCGSSSSYAQFYANGTTTITPASGITITSVVLTASSTSYNGYQSSGTFTASTGSVSGSSSSTTVTWTGSATSAFTISNNKQIRWTSIVVTYTTGGGTPTCATPSFSIPAGTYYETQSVELSCATDGATIYYTTNEDTPSTSSSVYSSAISVSSNTTIKAYAVKDGCNDSEVATATYTIKPPIPGYAIDFEESLAAYIDWTFTNAEQSTGTITANGGTYYATTGGKATASFQTKTKVAYPDVFTCYVSKTTSNTTASTWAIEVSSDGSSWTEVESKDAKSMVQGTWEEFTGNIRAAGYTDVYVRLSYAGSTAVRAVDDISLTTYDPDAPSVTVDSENVDVNAAGASGTIAVSYENFTLGSSDIIYYEADGTSLATYDHSWLTASINASNNIAYSVSKNPGDARVAYFKVYALDGSANEYYSNLITINQAAASVSYAVLPFSFNEGRTSIVTKDGLSHDGLDSDYGSENTKLKFNTAGDYLILKINEAPGTLTFSIKGNGSGTDPWAGTFTVQASTNGVDYSDVESYTTLGDDTKTISSLASDVRYIKWVYTTKTAGNVGLGNINLTKPASNPATITITATENGGKYYTTFYNGSARYVLPAGAKAFTMNSDHELYQLGADGSVIPSGTAVIIIAENASITLTKSDDASAIAVNGGTNILQGSNSPKDIYSISGTPYVLGIVTGTLGFYEFTGDGIPAYKAYYEN